MLLDTCSGFSIFALPPSPRWCQSARKGSDNQTTTVGRRGWRSLRATLGPPHWLLLPSGRACLFLPGLLDAAGPAWGVAAALGPNPLHWPGRPPTSQPLLMLAANLHPSPAFCPGWKGGSHQPWRWTLANAYFSRVTSTISPHPTYAPVPQAFLQFLHH